MKTATSLVALMAVCSILTTACQTTKPSANEWEYKVVERNLYPGQLEPQLNELANAGWSVVTVSTTFQGESLVPKGLIVLRRPKVRE